MAGSHRADDEHFDDEWGVVANADVRSMWMASATPSTSTTGPNQPHSDAKLGPGKAEMEQVGKASIDASSHGSS